MEFEFTLDLEHELRSLTKMSILRESANFRLDSSLVCAIMYQESYKSCKNFIEATFASRYEHGFYEKYLFERPLVGVNPNYNKVSRPTERRSRAMSFGSMQIMLQTAREFGFNHPFGPALCWPTANVHYACKILKKYLITFGPVDGIRKYNGSINNPNTLVYYENIQSHLDSKRYLEILDG